MSNPFLYSQRMRASWLAVVLALCLLVSPACDSVNPVAPEGSVLSVSVSPTFIELTGVAEVTVVARKPNGQPVNPGTESSQYVPLIELPPPSADVMPAARIWRSALAPPGT